MIKRAQDLNFNVVKNLMNGEGEIGKLDLFDKEDFCGMGRLFSKLTIKPGNSVGYHEHNGEQEAYYILKGEALYNDNGVEVNLKEGDFTLCKSGEGHSIKNIGENDLELIALIHNV